MNRLANVLLRSVLITAALASASWSIAYFANADQAIQLDDIANRIMSGDAFQQKPLASLAAVLDAADKRSLCNPREIRAVAIIRLRQYEEAVSAADLRLAEGQLKVLRTATDRALSCVPTEGFLWFIRYWIALSHGGSAAEHFHELRMSYALSPFEGWVAVRRSPYVLAIYETLPPDLKEQARQEFVAMVNSAFVEEATRILEGPGWLARKELLAGLSNVRLDLRMQFDKRLRTDGFNVEIPGVAPTEFRPWQ
ncbi:hypothetical protein NLM33_17735 [Bradyrhizobium sp. CCGUVB1N3]|uniref:hypothetical protein n=1 Tax=Bradyrhizobium sp. CCGUVB1N3 TaxID=2949629 RepID=UPI0020B382B9|nr:hypothetical protein [Bradyrhizobium sp. CCGUVB1N3]MCP3472158.1 hypothetical protein [Bradyrhizobium sp. CCGUVB1N3]